MLINSILDNDQYKFTMQQAILKLGFAATPVEYAFKDRDGINYSQYFDEICEEINNLKHLQITPDELLYLKSIRYFSSEYLEFLKFFKFDPSLVTSTINHDGIMDIRIKGSWFQTILFEIPILSIISEIRSRTFSKEVAKIKLNEKIRNLPDGFTFADFCTRRRASFEFQDFAIKTCLYRIPHNFYGTSNMYFAKKYNITPIGTMSHEWPQAHQQLGYRVSESQKMSFENWIKVYRGDLGIALADVINTQAFLKDFDEPLFYKLFDGVREDSEPDPKKFGEKMIWFYQKNKIAPMTKRIVFSNSLTFTKALDLYDYFKYRIGVLFGIGTQFGNDNNLMPPNIVLKMVKCNGQPVAKISNSPGKGMCESPEYVDYLKSVYGVVK